MNRRYTGRDGSQHALRDSALLLILWAIMLAAMSTWIG